MTKTYDVYEDSYMAFRIAQNVSFEWVQSYCASKGLNITREHQRGVFYYDAFVK